MRTNSRKKGATERTVRTICPYAAGRSSPMRRRKAARTQKLKLCNRIQAAVVAHGLGLVDDEFRPTDRTT
ncbi:hypothetical protein [Streptomyces sp. NPDC026666]|uniref:hypothetical protein n=1 Tax=Streptomyces sp. NPDC026666 TaxID=3154799 RepID=UPI003456C68F